MGYMGLESWIDSDRAADLRRTIEDKIFKKESVSSIIDKEIEDRCNCYNTEGCVNLALLLEDGILAKDYITKKQVSAVRNRLLELLEDNCDEYHSLAYVRLWNVVKKFLNG